MAIKIHNIYKLEKTSLHLLAIVMVVVQLVQEVLFFMVVVSLQQEV